MSGVSQILTKYVTRHAIERYLSNSFQQNLPKMEKRYSVVDTQIVSLNQCDRDLKYLYMVLSDTETSLEEKERLFFSILKNYVKILKTDNGRRRFVLCMFSILSMLAMLKNISSYHLMLNSIRKAIQKGDISKLVGYGIIVKLRRIKLLVNPELDDIVKF